MKKVALIGLGAMGVLYSDLLYGALQDDFFVIADEKRINRYKTEGVYCNGVHCQFPYRSAAEAEPVGFAFGGCEIWRPTGGHCGGCAICAARHYCYFALKWNFQ